MSTPARYPRATDSRLEAIGADATESFAATVGLVDGTRSEQIVAWARVFAMVAGRVETCERSAA